MKQPPLSDLTKKFIRPASIAIRFTGATDTPFRHAITFYATVLGLPEPLVIHTPQYDYCSFPVGRRKRLRKKDIEFRLEWRQKDGITLQNRTIIYWEIAPENIARVEKTLLELGFKLQERDKSNPRLPEDDRFLVADMEGNLFGGHPNPTFPPGILLEALSGPVPAPRRNSLLKSLVGLVLGTLLLGTFQRLRRIRS